MLYSVPNHLIFRHYGDDTIIINNQTKKTLFLTSKAQAVWKRLQEAQKWENDDLIILQKLTQLGFVENNVNSILAKNSHVKKSFESADLSAINLWSFRNHIPLSGHFELTGRCNLRCVHCYCTFEQKRDMLSTQDVFKIIDDLHDAGTLGLVLTGGEIFLRRDIGDILQYLQEKRFILRINTNATLLDEKLLKLVADLTNIYRIHVSLYSAEPEVHDAVTKVKGSFQKTRNNLIALKEAGHDLRINCSVMQTNAASYQNVKTYIGNEFELPVHFDPFIFPKDDGTEDNLTQLIDDEMFADYDFFTGREQKSESTKPKLCKAAFSFFSIDEVGNVYPCLKMKKSMVNPLGKVPKERFSDIWQSSKQVQSIRASLENKLRNCSVCELEM